MSPDDSATNHFGSANLQQGTNYPLSCPPERLHDIGESVIPVHNQNGALVKSFIKKVPIISDFVRWIMEQTVTFRQRNFVSGEYWESRYAQGRDSGAGSYNRLAQYKAEFLNEFVAANAIDSIIEFGSGDGAQLELAQYPLYTGVDVSGSIISYTKEKFRGDQTKSFLELRDYDGRRAELALSLDVIYHLVEDDVFEGHMRTLFSAAKRFVIIYSSNSEVKSDSPHVKHRNFTDWVQANTTARLIRHERNRYPYEHVDPDGTSSADFYVYEVS